MCDICRAVELGIPREDAVEMFDAAMRDTIEMYGWAITGVDDAEPRFFYTVGRTLQGLPELMVAGLDPHRSVGILNTANEMGAGLMPGRVPGLIQPPDFVAGVILCDPVAAEMKVALRLFHDQPVTALQIVWPDRQNRLPVIDADYDSEFAQPIHLPQGN